MNLPTFSQIAKGKIFENDVMGFSQVGSNNPINDEMWAKTKEDDIINKLKSGGQGLFNKDINLKEKLKINNDKIKNSHKEWDRINFNFNLKNNFGRKNKMTINYEDKARMIMGGMKGNEMSFEQKSNMLFGQPKKSKVNLNKQNTQVFNMLSMPKNNINRKNNQISNMLSMGKNNINTQDRLNQFLGKQSYNKTLKYEKKVKDNVNWQPEMTGWNRMDMQKKLNMFGDFDKDGVPNIFDCNPFDPNKQAKFHEWLKEKGIAAKEGAQSLGRRAKNLVVYGKPYDVEYINEESAPPTLIEKYKQSREDVEMKKLENIEKQKDIAMKQASMLEEKRKAIEAEEAIRDISRPLGFIPSPKERREKANEEKELYLAKLKARGTMPIRRSELRNMYSAVSSTPFTQNFQRKSRYLSPYSMQQPIGYPQMGGALGIDNSIAKIKQMASLGGGIPFEQTATQMSNIKADSIDLPERISTPQIQTQQQYQQMEYPEQQITGSNDIRVIEGVQYMRLPDGRWRNLKTGSVVTYPRGRYSRRSKVVYVQPPMYQQS